MTLAALGFAVAAFYRGLLGHHPGQLLLGATAMAGLGAVAVWAGRGKVAVAPWLLAAAAVVAGGHAAGDDHRIPATLVGTTHAALGLAWGGVILALARHSGGQDLAHLLRRIRPMAVLGGVALAVAGIALTALRIVGVEDRLGAVALDSSTWAFAPPRLVEDAWRWPRIPPAAPVLLLTAAVVLAAIVAIAAGLTVQAVQQIDPAPGGAGAMPPDGELDLLAADCRDRSNGDLFALTSGDFSGTTMPAYDAALTEEERWALVAHLRTLERDRPDVEPTPPSGTDGTPGRRGGRL